ncbi:DNA polymerase [Salmonella enterica subsp. enterica serovar Montevideo]|nr:DNA polymerase [Salmonella enterica subsp. enterica serovar Montevideo]KAA6658868.1 DNA polymerase [Salmonella enterica subsp. enterica serovar Montevideo]KAA6669285.1 DNA polymerase [Salmonella enterica subsp. enterica serovar Montevideo]KAA6686552.1 DNA polymerase [Salmonella enterica subsp. enterica serovar Montevideo]KAA7170221.1 DNA polymerase [Salmonella enterica subsp. enterica serovar Montevideo]
MNSFDLLFLDTETFSPVDLKKSGAYAYSEHPETEIMICSYAFDYEPVRVWDSTDGSRMPEDLRKGLRQVQRGKAKLVMQNGLLFDRLLMRECWDIDIDPRNIIDTMICAFRHSLPGSLDALCQVLQVEEENAKDKRGKALIQRFCKPTPKNYKVRRYTKETHPGEWAEFLAYAKSDISAMREVYHSLPQWGNIEFENTVLAVDQRINDRGFYVDTALANAAIDAVKQHKIELQAEANAKWGAGLTGADFLPTLRDLAPGHEIPNAQKSTLNDLLADDDLPDDARTIIEMRLGASSTASTKYNPLLLGLSADGRRRGCLQYGGAKRTLRWAGKGFQPQNLARGHFSGDELDQGIDMLLKGRAHWLYDVSKLTASTVRGCIIPTAGNKLVVADYSNVEGRGLAWLAGEESALATFLAGLDIYCVTAGKMFGLDPDHIKQLRKDLRQIGKACELGLGYGGGVAAFLTFAKNLGLDLYAMAETMKGTFPEHIWAAAMRGYEYARIQEKNKKGFAGQKAERPSYDLPKNVWLTCDSIKRMWRESHPATCQFWNDLESAAMNAIKDPGTAYWAGAAVRENGDRAIKITRTFTKEKGERVPGWWLKVELPSGRVLSYPGIGISVEKQVDGDDDRTEYRERIRYMGENQTTRQWGKQYTYGGKLAENVTQALCRDLLAYALVNVDAAGWPIILHVHDEIVTEVPNAPEYSVAKLEEMMCALPSWAAGFPLAAEGAELMRYAK